MLFAVKRRSLRYGGPVGMTIHMEVDSRAEARALSLGLAGRGAEALLYPKIFHLWFRAALKRCSTRDLPPLVSRGVEAALSP